MKTKVLYLDHTSKLGGAEFALLRLFTGIDRNIVDPVVLFADEGAAPDLFRASGVETHVLQLSKKVLGVRKDDLSGGAFLHVGRAIALVIYAIRVAWFARRHHVRIIHTNSMKAHFYGGLAGRLAGIPVVWHIRDFIDTTYLPAAAVSVVRFLARILPTYVVAVSQSVMNQILANGSQSSAATSGRSAVVHDGLSEDELDHRGTVHTASAPNPGADHVNSPTALNGLGGKEFDGNMASPPADDWTPPVRIGLIGRLAPWKGQHVLLQAAAKLLNAGYDARFLIAGAPLFGEDAYAEDLRKMADSLGIASKVEFLGFRKDVSAVLNSLHIFVHASTSADPCPNTILEGMAHGLPVIGTNGGGVPELILDGETGLLAPMGDADGLASALKSLLDDPPKARQFGRAGYVRVRKHFSIVRVASQIHEVYRRISPTPEMSSKSA